MKTKETHIESCDLNESQEYLEDIQKILEELTNSFPFNVDTLRKNEYKWELPSTIINSLNDLGIDVGFWGARVDVFENLFQKQIDILKAIHYNNRIVLNKQSRYKGVSTALLLYCYHFARQNSGSDIAFISGNEESSKRMYDLFFSFCGPGSYRDKNLISLRNGSKIRFSSDASPMTLMFGATDLVIVDDTNNLKNIQGTVNNLIGASKIGGKICMVKWSSFAFKFWTEVEI